MHTYHFVLDLICSSPLYPPNTELKELIAMHSTLATHGGDLKTDTVTIIGATLDLQEKVVKQVTPLPSSLCITFSSHILYSYCSKQTIHRPSVGNDAHCRGVHAIY
jgi:hypothetical protein